MSDDDNSASYYFSEDIVINILQWLPIISCIARFRCVCRSWRTLHSNPNVIRKILFHRTSHDPLQVLISGSQDFHYFSPLLHSTYSYETVRPIQELVTPIGGEISIVVGCCDGIFCLAHTTRDDNGNYLHTTILWNPVTSETKIIPRGPYNPCHSSHFILLYLRAQRIGFGYDPKTNDYKVVRVMEFEDPIAVDGDYMYDYDPAQFYHDPTSLIFT